MPTISLKSADWLHIRRREPRVSSAPRTEGHSGHSRSFDRSVENVNSLPSQLFHDLAHGLGSHPLPLVLGQTSTHILDGL